MLNTFLKFELCRNILVKFWITVEMSGTQTGFAKHHYLTLFYRRWRIWGSLLVSCGIGMRWTLHSWTIPITWISNTPGFIRWVHCPFELPAESRSCHSSYLQNVAWILSHLIRSTFQPSQTKARNTLEHAVCQGMLNPALCTTVCLALPKNVCTFSSSRLNINMR